MSSSINISGLYNYAYEYCRQAGIPDDRLRWVYDLPEPSEVEDEYFLGELAWCVFNSGMREALIRQKWPALTGAYYDFQARYIVEFSDYSRQAALKVINHPTKVEAVITAAMRIVDEGPMGQKLGSMTEQQALDYLQTFPFIGSITKFHLARNIGYDVVKPDRHIVRLTEFFGYKDCDAFVSEIAAAVGERKGHVDYILWEWLRLNGPDAYQDAVKFKYMAS